MSFDLINQTTQITRIFSRQSWAKALELAHLYGWQPMGTLPPSGFDFYKPIADWHGAYLTNDGQIVKTADAIWLADALEKSLGDIPDTEIKIDWNSQFWLDDDLPEWLSPEEKELIEGELKHHQALCAAPFGRAAQMILVKLPPRRRLEQSD